MKRILAALCAAAVIGGQSLPARAADTQHVLLTAAGTQDEVTLTVAVRGAAFNTLQFAVEYDTAALTPGEEAITYLAPVYNRGKGWMRCEPGETRAGLTEYTVYADPGSRGKEDGSDEHGFVAAGTDGLPLVTLHFTRAAGSSFGADTIRLAATASNPDKVLLMTKDADAPAQPIRLAGGSIAQRDFTALGVPLADTAEPADKPDDDNKEGSSSSNGSGSGSTGNAGGTSSGSAKPSDPSEKAPAFTDLESHWAASYITDLAARGVLGGYPDGTFRPENSLTRAELAVMAAKLLRLEPLSGETGFADVDGTWSAPYVGAAAKAGLVNGVGGGLFEPERAITRQETLKILAQGLKLPAADAASFPDSAEIAPWAVDAVNRAAAAGLVQGGTDGALHPEASITRGELAAMVSRALAA